MSLGLPHRGGKFPTITSVVSPPKTSSDTSRVERSSSGHPEDSDSLRASQETTSQFSNELLKLVDSLAVAAATDDENASVENRWCQLLDTIKETALVVLGRARRQHQDWPDDKDVAIGNLHAEKNHLHKAYVGHPT
nr:unnamed protein product [Spirometra erinaceieuropaei]